MKIFITSELTNLLQVSQSYISQKIASVKKHNFDNNADKNYISIKGKNLYFRKKFQGKGYEFCEIPFNELLIIDKSSFNSIFMSEIENKIKQKI